MNTKIKKLTDEEQSLYSLLIDKYGVLVSATKVEELLKESKTTLYRKRKNGIGPKFLQDKSSSTIKYPLHEIVRYLCNTKEVSR